MKKIFKPDLCPLFTLTAGANYFTGVQSAE